MSSKKTISTKNSTKIQRNYISSIDKVLIKFDQNNPISVSQQAEISKYQDIILRREQRIKSTDDTRWQDF